MVWVLIIIIGILLFSLSAGNYLYLATFKRSGFEKNSFIKNEAHVKDQKIIEPLTKAKQRWIDQREERNIERVTINGYSKKDLGKKILLHTVPVLCGEFWEPEIKPIKKAVIIVHGFSDSSSGMGYLCEEYHAKNFLVLAVNLRAHGLSTGDYPGLGYLDAKDMLKWITYVKKRYGSEIEIILHGVSMGGGTVVQTLFSSEVWKDNKCVLSGAVADCSFGYFKDQMNIQIKRIFGISVFQNTMGKLIYAGCTCACFIHAGFFIGKSSPINKIKNLQISGSVKNKPFLLIFQGTKDTLVYPKNADIIYSAAEAKSVTKNIVIKIKNAPHIGSYFYEPENYMNSIMKNT
jgi:fermentation-respiration switch protein FrsA (DUF1100 family)